MATYALDNAWEHAQRRLALLERHLDPMTQRRIEMLGIRPGWRCLEVGGGGGSVARWLCGRVAPAGRVLATDINIRFLQEIEHPCLEAKLHDITSEDLPEGGFDLVHARWLLHHLPDPRQAIHRMAAAVRPGGWLLLEEVDFFPVLTSNSDVYVEFMLALTGTVVKGSGRNCLWARALPALMAGTELTRIGGEGDFAVLQGGSPIAEFFSLTAEQMRERMLLSQAIRAERLDEALALLHDPAFWAFAGGGVAIWGQRAVAY